MVILYISLQNFKIVTTKIKLVSYAKSIDLEYYSILGILIIYIRNINCPKTEPMLYVPYFK